MPSDAPDYTLLSDVQIVGTEIMVAMDLQGATIAMPIDVQGATIALPVDIQGQTINLDVNIAASSVTIDVNISAQSVDVKIVTPPGTPVYIGTSYINTTYIGGVSVSPGTESEILSITGRGRVSQMGFHISSGAEYPDRLMIRVYLDGSTTPQIEFNCVYLDYLNGYQILPQGTPGAGTSYYATTLSKDGGWVIYYADGAGNLYAGIVFSAPVEFKDGCVIKAYNNSSTDTITVAGMITYGAYP